MTMESSQGEIRFVTNFPSKETLRLLLEAHNLFNELQSEKRRQSLMAKSDAIQILDIPMRMLANMVKEGVVSENKEGKIYRYQVIQILFEMKQSELFNSIK